MRKPNEWELLQGTQRFNMESGGEHSAGLGLEPHPNLLVQPMRSR